MALLCLESFEHLANGNEKYTTQHATLVSISATYSRSGTRSLKAYAGYYCAFEFPITDTGVIGFAMRAEGYIAGDVSILDFYRDTGITLYLYITKSGMFQVRRGSTILACEPNPMRRGVWHYVEVKFNIVNSIGADTFQVRVDGELVLNVPTGSDCQNQASSGVNKIWLQASVSYTYFNDVYICDLTGSDWNDFQGDIVVETLYPNGNGTTNDFTGSDADSTDNYLHVDDATPDDDSTYSESSTVTDVDLYDFDNSNTPDTVLAVAVDCFCKMDDAGPKSGKIIAYINSSTYEGDTFSLTTGYVYETQLWELNPDDSAAWVAADVDGAEFGVKVEA